MPRMPLRLRAGGRAAGAFLLAVLTWLLACVLRMQAAVAHPGAGVGRGRLCGFVVGVGCESAARRRACAAELPLLICRGATRRTTTMQDALPDDPAVLKLLLTAKDTALRSQEGELAAKNGELAAKDTALAAKNGELAAKNGELAAKNGELAAVKEGKANLHAQVMALENRLGCRSVLEGLEQKLSTLRRSNPRAQRKKVWREILTREPAYFKQLLRALDLGERAKAMTEKEQREAVVESVAALYQRMSSDIHNPGLRTVPIHLPYLGPIHGASMIIHCQKYEVSYSLYDEALRLEFPPPEVARLLGEVVGEDGDEGDNGM